MLWNYRRIARNTFVMGLTLAVVVAGRTHAKALPPHHTSNAPKSPASTLALPLVLPLAADLIYLGITGVTLGGAAYFNIDQVQTPTIKGFSVKAKPVQSQEKALSSSDVLAEISDNNKQFASLMTTYNTALLALESTVDQLSRGKITDVEAEHFDAVSAFFHTLTTSLSSSDAIDLNFELATSKQLDDSFKKVYSERIVPELNAKVTESDAPYKCKIGRIVTETACNLFPTDVFASLMTYLVVYDNPKALTEGYCGAVATQFFNSCEESLQLNMVDTLACSTGYAQARAKLKTLAATYLSNDAAIVPLMMYVASHALSLGSQACHNGISGLPPRM